VFVRSIGQRIYRRMLIKMGHNSHLRQEFYSNPRYWQSWVNETGFRLYKAIIQLMEKHELSCNGKHIADIGCGTGHLLLKIRETFHPTSLTGTEINESAIAIARTTVPEADIRYDNILETRIERKFDMVFCTEVLEHLLEAAKALEYLLAITNSKGTIIVTVPNGRTDTFIGHVNFFSPESWDLFVKNNCQKHVVHTGLLPNCAKLFAIIELS